MCISYSSQVILSFKTKLEAVVTEIWPYYSAQQVPFAWKRRNKSQDLLLLRVGEPAYKGKFIVFD